MIDLIALTTALATTLQNIPELVALLPNADPARIVAYLDSNPARNSVINTLYEMPSGLIYVAWERTILNETQNSASMWTHTMFIYCRADTGKSPLDILKLVVDGIPNPGDGMRWRNCGIMTGVLPADIKEISRQPDREGIDFYIVNIEINETGDA
jgi:hypothetical protein